MSVITHPKDRLSSDTPDQDNSTLVPQFQRIARKVMLYPIAYICLMAPSAAVIIISLSGIKVPKGVTLFTMTLVWLNGLADVILFILTRPAILADPTFLPRPLRSLVGRLSDNRGSAKQPNLHDLSIQEVTSPPMGHTGGMNMRLGAERAWEDEGGLHVAPSQGQYDPMAPRDTSTPLTHHHFNSLSLTACSSNFPDRRDVSFEDEGGGTYGSHTSRRWGNETPWVQEEGRYIHYPQLQPLHHPFMRVSPTIFDRPDLQTNEDGPTIQHPYNTHPMIR
ncbi:hypothetical protein FRC17_000497 [Serendipita sp. 399]|nr:hypothetical protein FRC17_000497 [Serendipita sp. 399]